MQDQVPNQDQPGANDMGQGSNGVGQGSEGEPPGPGPLALPKLGFMARIKNFLLDLDARLDFGLFRGALKLIR